MRVRVLGAGIIGLTCADELVRGGHDVTVVDPAPGSGASHAAAGMLSPAAEVWHDETALLTLGLESLALWPAFAARLDVRLEAGGTVLVARDAGDLQQVERQRELLAAHGQDVELLGPREVCRLEPSLSTRVAGGALLASDLRVDPRAVVASLLARIPVRRAASDTDVTVIATGAALPAPYSPLVRAVRGEIVRARAEPADLPRRTVRGWVRGEPVYVVPRADGEVVIGATAEEHAGPPQVTVGGIARLLEAARALVPALDRAVFAEAIARDRPATVDHLPIVGFVDERTVLAAGHYRHGVLLAPLTARLVADCLTTGRSHPLLDPRRLEVRT